MALSRRQFLRCAGTGLGLGLSGIPLIGRTLRPGDAAPNRPVASPAGTGNPLRMPATHSGDRIVAGVKEQQIWSDAATRVWTYNNDFPAPTIRVRSGDSFSTRLVNNLEEPTNIHWHGLIVPPAMDGHPKDVTAPGGTYDYSFTVNQRAGTYWYHPHPHMATAKQVYFGMAGFFIVSDDEEASFGLPGGAHDIPLLIQDRRIEPDRSLLYGVTTDDEHLNGFLGDAILVNGTPEPYLEVGAGLYRFRVLNGSNARVLDLALADGKRFHVIGTDGGLLDKPYEVEYCYVAPGERMDILIDFSSYSPGQSVMMKSHGFTGGSGRDQGSEMQVIRFDIVRPADQVYALPSSLATIEKLDPAKAARTREFILRIDHMSTPDAHTINNKTYDMIRIDEEVKRGDTEIWTIRNISFLHHPMHLHGAQFQVLDRGGRTDLDARDRGWKDTIYMRPFETINILLRFAPWPGTYLFHCHNLEHEDHGMMLNFAVVESNSGVARDGDMPTVMDLR